LDKIAGEDIAVMWYGPTHSAIAYNRLLGDELLTLYADAASPETAPFKDKETRSRWTLAGRAVDRRLQGKELKWVRGGSAAGTPGRQSIRRCRFTWLRSNNYRPVC
jgi:hypothetical protein